MSNETKAPQPPAEAQAQGGGEVCIRCGDKPESADYNDPLTLRGLIEYVRVAADPNQGAMRWHALNLLKQALPHLQRLDAITAPPSAPVGVEGVEAALQKWLDWCNEHNEEPEARSGARIAIEAIAHQPVTPVGVERKYPDDGNGDDDAYNRGWNDCLDALAQQPAADERPVGWWNGILPDVTNRSPYDPSIRWGADAENSGHDIPLYAGVNPSRVQQPAAVDGGVIVIDGRCYAVETVRTALLGLAADVALALAAQQGGRSDD